MASSVIVRRCLFPRPSRRNISRTSSQRTSTSPQRRNVVAPAVNTPLKKFTDIPGPLALPMLRHHAHILPRIGCFHHTVGISLLEKLHNRYGDLVRLAKASRSRPVLYVFDPALMQEVYDSKATEIPVWPNSPLDEHRSRAGACPVHSNDSKAIWSALETLLQDGVLVRNYEKLFDDIAADFTRRLGELRHAGNALNEELGTEIYRWALETIGVMIFGIRLGCLDGAVNLSNKKHEKSSMDDEIQEQSLSQRCLDLSPAERLVRCSLDISNGNYLVRSESTLKRDTQIFDSSLKLFDKHLSLTEHFMVKALNNLNNTDLKPEQILLDKLKPLGARMLPLTADIFLAGVDPLAHTAISMFYQLALHAAQQQRAHDEVLWSKAAKEAGIESPEMLYIAACVREVMRLHPATGGVVRRSKHDLIVGDYEVPSGVDIVLAHGVSSKIENEWRRAKSFIPDRWYHKGWEPVRASGAHATASLPFGQTCPAAGIVGTMLSSLATRVVDVYRLEWHGPPATIMTTSVNKLEKPYFFVLQNAA